MFKPGSIRKITVVDFVTYSYVEMLPGPNLNMLIGPNGSGKSSIVAAIILGLGGNPKTIGRGTKISEYVKHNCMEATITIDLQTNTDKLMSITRRFDTHEKSQWVLNGKKVTLKEILDKIKQFNIQVDNLCQFLPQDRVQDFAKMNKQQLLQQTQVALCRNDLISTQKELIQIRDKHKELQTAVEKYAQRLQELQDTNVRIEGKVKNLRKKKKYLQAIDDFDRKMAWMKYENFRTKMDDIKKDKVKAVELLSKYKEDAKPVENAISNARRTIMVMENKVINKNQEIRQYETTVQNKLSVSNRLKNDIKTAKIDFETGLKEIQLRDQNIAEANEQMNNLVVNKARMLQTFGDDEQRHLQIKTQNEDLKKLSVHINKVVEKKDEIENTKRNKNYELRTIENELTRLENVKEQRLEWLRRIDQHAYNAVQWLRSNKHMFKGEIYEPMILELNVLNPQHAVYIENIIPLRDKVAITCVLKEDMNLLIRLLREQQKLSVNIVYSGSDQPALERYRPVIPIEQLKAFGMFAYVRSLVTGPEPIMKYLCKTYQIHDIPVGNSSTNQLIDRVPSQITNFFSDIYRFSTSYSKYTGSKSTRQNEIKPDGSLAISCDAERMESIRAQLVDMRSDSQRCDEEIRTLDMQIGQLNVKDRSIREKIRELQKCKNDIQGIDSQIRVLDNKLKQMQSNPIILEHIQNDYDQRVEKAVQKMVACQSEIKEAFKKYAEIISRTDLDQMNLEITRKQMAYLVNKSLDMRRLLEETEHTVQRINESFSNSKNNAKLALIKAKDLSEGFTPDDDGFSKYREAYNNLSNNLEELECEKEQVISKIDYLNTADVGELKEYEERQQQISNLEVDIQDGNDKLDRFNGDMEKLKMDWLEPLQQLVNEINQKFSSAFHKMGCAGDISIFKGENENDFGEYGLSIKVKYRNAEPLQELNNIVQSGGERAVATAAFMLSLQELTPVPFRCVDEINQGMDSNNERRIFELLVDVTSQENSSQYFFITPKLVPNLKFVPNMQINFVHNAPFVPQQKEWNDAVERIYVG